MNTTRPRNHLVVVLLTICAAVACSTVPHTGRSQLSLVSEAELIAAADRSYSSFIRKNADRVVVGNESADDARRLASVLRVSEKIIAASGLKQKLAWQTVLVRSKEANAFVLPNGKIVVFTGLLPVVKHEEGLAAVLGHEVAHVVAQHGNERASQQLAANLTLTTISVVGQIVGASNPQLSRSMPLIGAALGLGAQYGVLLPYSRAHESEADRIGLIFAAKAGYDPGAAIGVWERMQARNGSGPWEFLSTHPSPSTRITQIRDYLPEARKHMLGSSAR